MTAIRSVCFLGKYGLFIKGIDMDGELCMKIGDALASSGMESALELALKYIKDCVSKRNLKLAYREFIASLLKFKNIESQDIDNIVKLLKAVNGNSNIDLLKHKLTENLSTYFTNREDAEAYACLILQFLVEVNSKAKRVLMIFWKREGEVLLNVRVI